MKALRATLLLLCLLFPAAAVAAPDASPLAGPCAPGPVYDPACDVDHDGDVDIFDIQLTAGHWNRSGTWSGGGDGWSLTGNSGTNAASNFLGTSDNQPLVIRVNGQQALLIRPSADPNVAPSIIAGQGAMQANVRGAVIAGGGSTGNLNFVTDHYGAIGGGVANLAGNADGDQDNAQYATVGGGYQNAASGSYSTVGGGERNTASGLHSTVGGGGGVFGVFSEGNTASGERSTVGGGKNNTASGQYSTVSGGDGNTASDYWSTVGGGYYNLASGKRSAVGGGDINTASGEFSTVGGGFYNFASGEFSTVPGGRQNTAAGNYSFAAGRRAQALANGSFVWADNQDRDFTSATPNQFLVRASNGGYFESNNLGYTLLAFNDSVLGQAVRARTDGTYAGYFEDDIFVGGQCTGCLLAYVAVNVGGEALAVGDLVAPAGLAAPLEGSGTAVLRVQQAGAGQGVVGVVTARAELHSAAATPDGATEQVAERAVGAIQPGDYLFIAVQGLTPVKIAAGETVAPGQRLTVAGGGAARALRTVAVEGVTVDESAPTVGVLVEAPDPATGLAQVMVSLR